MPKKRRGHNEGSIFQRKKGPRAGEWVGTLMLGRDTQGRIQRRSVTGRTRAEVTEKLRQLMLQHESGTLSRAGRMTVANLLEKWLAHVRANLTEPKSIYHYEHRVRLHLLPALGHISLRRLAPADLQKLYDDKSGVLAPQTVLHIHRTAHAALEYAVRVLQAIPRNPADAAAPPSVPKRQKPVLAMASVRAYLAALEGHRLHALYVAAILTGCRQSELFALRWEDIDTQRHTITIRQKVHWHEGSPWFGPAKTDGSHRAVVLLPELADVLHRHRQAQEAERGPEWRDFGLVFCQPTGLPLRPWHLRRAHADALASAGLPSMPFKNLRHTLMTLLATMDVHPRVTADIVGHSNTSTAMQVYQQVSPAMQREAMERLRQALFSPDKKEGRPH